MINKILLAIFLVLSGNVFSQPDPKAITSSIEENQNLDRVDSIAKIMKLKGGDQVKVFAQFTVNKEGNIANIVARASHPFFEQEAIRILKELRVTPQK